MAARALMDMLPPLTAGTWFSVWTVEPVGTLIAAVLAVGYLLVLLAHRHSGMRWPALHSWSFAAGVVLLVVSVDSAIGAYSHALFWMHMIQHLLLITVVPALLVMGHPIRLLSESGHAGSRVVEALRRNPIMSVLSNPVVALACYTVVLVGTHLTGYMQAMTQHMWLHSLEVALYLGSGYLFLLTLLVHEPIRWDPPYPARLGLLFVSMIVDAGVGIALMMADTDPFPGFAAMRDGWGPAALDDIHIGGAVMWVGGDGLMMAAIILLAARWITDTERQNDMGRILESVRRHTLVGAAFDGDEDSGPDAGGGDDASGGRPPATGRGPIDIDEDERIYQAYNRMLARLAESEERTDPPV
jgi:putative copper resistance protein D